MSVPFPELDTPALVVDLDVLERNIAEMAGVAANAGVRLRPHTKTHKCPEVARMQVDAGAAGITVAKLGEAEVMVDAGFDDVLVAYPLVGDAKLDRLRALRERARISVSLDSVEVAQGLARLGGEPIEVLVEVDTGHHRLGRPPGQPTVELVAQVAAVDGLDVVGLLTHGGHAYRSSPADLAAAAEREGRDLVETAERCAAAGVRIREISVGSTPTARAVAKVEGVTEIRPGTYVFNDVQQMRLGVADEATCAARVLATVVSRPWQDRFVIDAGSKSLSSDGGGRSAVPRARRRRRPARTSVWTSSPRSTASVTWSRWRGAGDRGSAPGDPAARLQLRQPVRRGGERARRTVERDPRIAGRGKVR